MSEQNKNWQKIYGWSENECEPWQKESMRKLLENQNWEDAAYEELINIVLKQTQIVELIEPDFTKSQNDTHTQNDPAITLLSISKVINMNALVFGQNNEILFFSNLTNVFSQSVA